MYNKRISKIILAVVLIFLFITDIFPVLPGVAAPQEAGPLYDADTWEQPFDLFDGSSFIISKFGILTAWGDNRLGVYRETNDFITMIPLFYYPYKYKPCPFLPAIMKMNIKSISVDLQVTLAVDGFGILWGWGANAYDPHSETVWKQIPKCIMGNVKMAATGTSSCLVLKEDGSVWAWRRDDEGHKLMTPYPLAISGVKYISLFTDQACAILENGDLYTWINVPWYSSADWPFIPADSPVKIASHAVQTAKTQEGLLILEEDHTLWSWNQARPDDELKKIADNVRFCGDGILITDDNRALLFNEDTSYGSSQKISFQSVTDNAVYAFRYPNDIYIENRSGRLLRFPCETCLNGMNIIGKPVTVYKNVKLPYAPAG